MNKTDLIFNISEKTGLPKTACREIIDLVLECVIERLTAGERVTLSNFGAFSVALPTTEQAVDYLRYGSVAGNITCRAETIHGYVKRDHQRIVRIAETKNRSQYAE